MGAALKAAFLDRERLLLFDAEFTLSGARKARFCAIGLPD